MALELAQSIQGVQGQPVLHRETLPQKHIHIYTHKSKSKIVKSGEYGSGFHSQHLSPKSGGQNQLHVSLGCVRGAPGFILRPFICCWAFILLRLRVL